MSKLFIVYRTDRTDGLATATRKAIQCARARGASTVPPASTASAAMTPSASTTTGVAA